MKIPRKGKLLRLFIGEADRHKGKPLFTAIAQKARELKLAGSTVLKGIEGYGAASRTIHTAHLLRLSEDLPIIIEIVDAEEKINGALPEIEKLIEEADCSVLITIETVEVLHYGPKNKKKKK